MALRKSRFSNPFLFTPLPVTIVTSIIYIGVIVALLITHLVVPAAPSNPTPVKGINITEAWGDLQELTSGFRPFNSRKNDEVRDFLLRRIGSILVSNDVGYATQGMHSKDREIIKGAEKGSLNHRKSLGRMVAASPSSEVDFYSRNIEVPAVIVFNDMVSNVTCSTEGSAFERAGEQVKKSGITVYFEGTNIVVYVRGSEDPEGQWWEEEARAKKKPESKGGVLVNAHYDSVSTGYGATDDGVGVVTVLQLIKYFTTTGNKPKKGLVVLLNNGEEDFLNGARAFTQHPISEFAHTFLNLEGAGAGGRATLFRSTDTEVTRFYQKSPYPFGSALSGDGFKRGLIRSQTDYVIFNGDLGLRGLDVAFMEPRARYHTGEDDTRHTSIDSLWHMLSAALATTKGLTSDTSSTFEGKSDTRKRDGKVNSGKGSDGVWFDMFGRAFAVFRLRTLFAISIALLIATPLILITVVFVLYKKEKMYLFSGKTHHYSVDDEPVSLDGWRGFFRFPIAVVVASAAVVGLAFLVAKVNPFIIYSSPYALWSMMLCAWLAVAWFIFAGANWYRPTALHRGYTLIWMYIIGWLILLAITVAEDRMQMASGYFMVFYFSGIFLAILIGQLEFFALPRKSDFANQAATTHTAASLRSGSLSSGQMLAPSADEDVNPAEASREEADEEATESTSLLGRNRRTTFANYTRTESRPEEADDEENIDGSGLPKAHGEEQAWSASLPQWTWLLQFILMAPIVIILVGQLGLLLTSALSQTPADGNSVLLIYIAIAVFSIFILVPLSPFLHRFTYHVPTFLFLIFIGTLIYNLLAFPFSSNNRLKLYFIQTVDLETGINQVSLTGIEEYVRQTISTLPSAADQDIQCEDSTSRLGLKRCGWNGLAPKVNFNIPHGVPPEIGYADWLSYNVTRVEGKNEALFHLFGRNTRACKLLFDKPISHFSVDGAGTDKRYKAVPEAGSKEARLWSREWEKPWDVNVAWPISGGKEEGQEGLDGSVVCLWSDSNESGVIPALDEVKMYAPVWVAASKLTDGLVEGSKRFLI
ncbi:MAG: hypothetical protein M1827_004848 [Pycnora praestabilis]|nr:MAG: hypothetical protein M1827_004848 [Pycnora praestabilis]